MKTMTNLLSLAFIAGLLLNSAGIAAPVSSSKLPRLVDLGADKCIPCKMMAPVLKELKTEYAGKMEVEFIDVWKNADAGKKYKIKLIPTQIFFDASGKEVFRHEGFFGKEDILKKWKELGVDFSSKSADGDAQKPAARPGAGGLKGEGNQKTTNRN